MTRPHVAAPGRCWCTTADPAQWPVVAEMAARLGDSGRPVSDQRERLVEALMRYNPADAPHFVVHNGGYEGIADALIKEGWRLDEGYVKPVAPQSFADWRGTTWTY